MSLFHHRPLALFCFLFAAAALCGCFLSASEFLIASICFSVLFIVFVALTILFKKHRDTCLYLLLCALFISASLWNFGARVSIPLERAVSLANEEQEVEMTVRNVLSSTSYRSSYVVQFSSDQNTLQGILFCEYPSKFQIGDVLFGNVTFAALEEYVASASYYKSKDIFSVLLSAENNLKQTGTGAPTVFDRFRSLNATISKRLHDTMDEDTASVISAVSLGNREGLQDSLLRDFKRTGITHILAISGMHLSIIILLLDRLLLLLGVRKPTRCISVFLIALTYLALIGFPLSAVRAFIMMTFVYLAYLFSAENDPVTALFTSLFLIFAASPCSVWDVGVWMSFLAVLGILVSEHFTTNLSSRLRKSRIQPKAEKLLRLFFSAVIVSVFANVFVCLPLGLFFDQLSLLSVPATLIISPFITLLLLLTPFLVLSNFLTAFCFLSPILSACCHLICNVVEKIVSYLSTWKGITVSLRFPFTVPIFLTVFILLFVALVLPLRKKFWIPLIPTVGAILFSGMIIGYQVQQKDTLTVDYIAREESEMLVISTPKDAVICDLSAGYSKDLHLAIDQAGIRYHTEISAIVFTHYHGRHVSTFSQIADQYRVRTVCLPYPKNESEFFTLYAMLDVANYKNIHVIVFDRGTAFSPAENISLDLSSPAYLKRSTHPTFLLTVSGFEQQVLYLGESCHEIPKLKELAERKLPQSDFVILGVHGPITKSQLTFEGLDQSKSIFVYDQNVLSHIDPTLADTVPLIYGSDQISFRLRKK